MDNLTTIAQWINNFISNILTSFSLDDKTELYLDFVIKISIVAIIAVLVHLLVKKIIIYYIIKFTNRVKKEGENYFIKRKVYQRLLHLIPATIIYSLSPIFLLEYPISLGVTNKLVTIYFIVMIFGAIQGLIRVLEDYYNKKPYSSDRSIRSYTQLIILITYLIAALIIVSYLFDVKVTKIFAGLGALAAVLMLVFKDTIMGLVAGIQLSANKMVHVGDWIEMPSYNADGDVLEITLNNVKVQNWDKTITNIPTYALVSNPFINWRGMQESGGRRIKRSISIDMQSVKFCTPEMLEKFKKIHHLKDYIEEREREIEEYNKEHNIDDSVIVNGRRLTNLGIFRQYLDHYCRTNPRVNTNLTFLIRHLQPTDAGIPIEVYIFSADNRWAKYEELQADIFDHILAVIPEFELTVFQAPSGKDIRTLSTK